jgi:hypothetical protein
MARPLLNRIATKRRLTVKASWIFLPVLIVFLFGFGCEDQFMTSESAVATNEAGQTLKLTASPDNLDISGGGAATILAELYAADGTGIEGANLVFTSSLGTLGANTAATDKDGIAITSLVAGVRPGYAVIVATYGSMQVMVSVDMYNGDPNGSGSDTTPPDIGGGDDDTTTGV